MYNNDNRLIRKPLLHVLFAAVLGRGPGTGVATFEMDAAMAQVTVSCRHALSDVTDIVIEEEGGGLVASLGSLESPAAWSIGAADL